MLTCVVGMDFPVVVHQIKELHVQLQQWDDQYTPPEPGLSPSTSTSSDAMYGRLCTSNDGRPPVFLSTDSERKSVFIFGQDTIQSVLLKVPTQELLFSLGYDQQYIHHKVHHSLASYNLYEDRIIKCPMFNAWRNDLLLSLHG